MEFLDRVTPSAAAVVQLYCNPVYRYSSKTSAGENSYIWKDDAVVALDLGLRRFRSEKLMVVWLLLSVTMDWLSRPIS